MHSSQSFTATAEKVLASDFPMSLSCLLKIWIQIFEMIKHNTRIACDLRTIQTAVYTNVAVALACAHPNCVAATTAYYLYESLGVKLLSAVKQHGRYSAQRQQRP